MFQELKAFAEIYYYDNLVPGNFIIIMLILYANAGLYIADFYRLIKRKSDLETFCVMIPPCLVAAIGSTMVSIFTSVPIPGSPRMVRFVLALSSRRLCASLLLLPGAYMLLWGFFTLLRRKQPTETKRNWGLSCMPDFVFCAVILAVCLTRLGGIPLPQWVIWVCLYCINFLFCKVILLLSCISILIFSMRITIFRWNEGKNPSAFLLRYFLLYQNAVFRNGLFYTFCMVVPLEIVILDSVRHNMSDETLKTSGGLLLCGVIILFFTTSPTRKAFGKFRLWSKTPNNLMETFCREYFLDTPIYRDNRYTITRHFLVDEQQPATLYYWPCLASCSGWSYSKKGQIRTLSFTDNSSCVLTQADAHAAEKIAGYAHQILETRVC